MDGEVYYSYHDQTGTYDNDGLTGYGPGESVILDKDFNEIRRITFEASEVVPKGFPLDGHDFLMIDLDHYILNGYIKGSNICTCCQWFELCRSTEVYYE